MWQIETCRFNITYNTTAFYTIPGRIFMELSKLVISAIERLCHAKNKLGVRE
jgi:hypothetical protein